MLHSPLVFLFGGFHTGDWSSSLGLVSGKGFRMAKKGMHAWMNLTLFFPLCRRRNWVDKYHMPSMRIIVLDGICGGNEDESNMNISRICISLACVNAFIIHFVINSSAISSLNARRGCCRVGRQLQLSRLALRCDLRPHKYPTVN